MYINNSRTIYFCGTIREYVKDRATQAQKLAGTSLVYCAE